jgi:hypothetical protein
MPTIQAAVAIAITVLMPAVSHAQRTLYVTDRIDLGLFASEQLDGEPIATLASGAELLVLDQIEGAARVQTPDGREGWVSAERLVESKPAAARLPEALARVSELEAEVAALTAQRQAVEAELGEYRGNLPWLWALGAVLVALGLGFVVGFLWLDAAIRRRHGGFRVY